MDAKWLQLLLFAMVMFLEAQQTLAYRNEYQRAFLGPPFRNQPLDSSYGGMIKRPPLEPWPEDVRGCIEVPTPSWSRETCVVFKNPGPYHNANQEVWRKE